MSVSLFGKKSKLKNNEHKTFSVELLVVQKVNLILHWKSGPNRPLESGRRNRVNSLLRLSSIIN